MTTTTHVDDLKNDVRAYWNEQPCGTQFSESEKLTREYFDEIEEHRYRTEPEIFAFAQFTRHHGEKMLEVGVGAGSDFLQWARAGARVHGIDATPAGVEHVRERLAIYGFEAEDLRVADAEALPHESNSFDLVYSWGVIHHTPNTPRALAEIVRVCKPGGTCKVMIYHKHSMLTWFFWVKYALLKGKPWKSPSWVLFHHMESIGTKAYTVQEAREMLAGQPVEDVRIRPVLTYYDRMERHGALLRSLAKVIYTLLGHDRVGWFLTMEFRKI